MIDDVDLTAVPDKAPRCLECRKRSRLSEATTCYPDEPHLQAQPVWLCQCGAFATCHKGTLMPRYRPSDAERRELRYMAGRAIVEWQRRYSEETGRSIHRAKKEAHRLATETGASFGLYQVSKDRLRKTIEVFSQPCARSAERIS